MQDEGEDTEVTGGGYRRPWALYAGAGILAVAVVVGVLTRFSGTGTPAPAPGPSASTMAAPSPPSPSPFPSDGESLPDGGESLAGHVELLPSPDGPWGPVARLHPVEGQNAGAGCNYEAPGLVLPSARQGGRSSGRSCVPARAARSIVLRSTEDGSFAQHSAVLTFPVGWRPGHVSGDRERRHGVRGWWTTDSLVWRVGDDFQKALVRGDLPPPTLARIARAFHLGDLGELQLADVPGLRVDHRALYRPPAYHQVAYRTDLLDCPVVTRVAVGAQAEDRLLAAVARPTEPVRGHQAVFVRDDRRAVLAWELDPGVVAMIGCVGDDANTTTQAALHHLADRTETISPTEWNELGPFGWTERPVREAPADPGGVRQRQ